MGVDNLDSQIKLYNTYDEAYYVIRELSSEQDIVNLINNINNDQEYTRVLIEEALMQGKITKDYYKILCNKLNIKPILY
jgi:hypothetical protein